LIFGVELGPDTFRWRFYISVEPLLKGIVKRVLIIGGGSGIVGVNGRRHGREAKGTCLKKTGKIDEIFNPSGEN
jgi:hypothetical protein